MNGDDTTYSPIDQSSKHIVTNFEVLSIKGTWLRTQNYQQPPSYQVTRSWEGQQRILLSRLRRERDSTNILLLGFWAPEVWFFLSLLCLSLTHKVCHAWQYMMGKSPWANTVRRYLWIRSEGYKELNRMNGCRRVDFADRTVYTKSLERGKQGVFH